MPDFTTEPESPQDFKCQYLLTHLRQDDDWLTCCPWATTTVAWSAYFNARVVVARQCGRWGCRYCGQIKCRRLAYRVEGAKPTKFITLTVYPKLFESPRQAYHLTRRKLADLSKLIRKHHDTFEYIRVLEVTKKGWPHYHLVARCPFIPQQWLSDRWNEMTGAPVVDIRRISDHADVYRYMMKYLAKQKYIPWTNRRVSWSRYFFPLEQKPTKGKWKLSQREWENIHPYEWLNQYCYGKPCTPIASAAWLIDVEHTKRPPQNRKPRAPKVPRS